MAEWRNGGRAVRRKGGQAVGEPLTPSACPPFRPFALQYLEQPLDIRLRIPEVRRNPQGASPDARVDLRLRQRRPESRRHPIWKPEAEVVSGAPIGRHRAS